MSASDILTRDLARLAGELSPEAKPRSDLVHRDCLVRTIDEATRTVDFIVSTEAVDSYGEIVVQDWDFASRFDSNPVGLWCHDRWDLPIGTWVKYGVIHAPGGAQLEATLELATAEQNPKAEMIWQLLKAKHLRAASVGFRPKTVRYERRNDRDIYLLSGNVLYEISVCTIGANPDALAKSVDPIAEMKVAAKALGCVTRSGDPVRDAMFAKAKAEALAAEKTNPSTAASAVPAETSMTEKELREALDKSEKSLADAKVAADAAATEKTALEERATKAEAASAEAVAKAAALEAEKSVIESALDKAGAVVELNIEEPEPGQPSVKKLSTSERVASIVAARDKALDSLTERDVEDLVGKKLTPAQKDDFVALAKADRGRFDAIVKNLPDLNLLTQAMPGGKLDKSTVDNGADDVELGEMFDKTLTVEGVATSDDVDLASLI